MVSNLGQPVPSEPPGIYPNTLFTHTHIGGKQSYAQSFCTGSIATTLDKVRLYTISKEADRTTDFYKSDPAPVLTIRSTDE